MQCYIYKVLKDIYNYQNSSFFNFALLRGAGQYPSFTNNLIN